MSNSVGDNCARNFVRNDGYVEGDPQKLATRRSIRARRENVHLRGYAHWGRACCWYDSLSSAPIFFLSSSPFYDPSVILIILLLLKPGWFEWAVSDFLSEFQFPYFYFYLNITKQSHKQSLHCIVLSSYYIYYIVSQLHLFTLLFVEQRCRERFVCSLRRKNKYFSFDCVYHIIGLA